MNEETIEVVLKRIAEDVKEIKEANLANSNKLIELERFIAKQSVINKILSVVGAACATGLIGIAIKVIFKG